MIKFIFFLIPVILLIPAFADNIIEEPKECYFSAHIEKSWLFFGDEPKVWGTIVNCDSNQYHEKDRVFVRILDINGELVKDDWQYRKKSSQSDVPARYEFIDDVFRGGGMGQFDNSKIEVIKLNTNEFFFYMPQIYAIHFEHKGVYFIELKYGDHIQQIPFATLDPNLPL